MKYYLVSSIYVVCIILLKNDDNCNIILIEIKNEVGIGLHHSLQKNSIIKKSYLLVIYVENQI